MPPESACTPLQTRTPSKQLVSQLIGATVSEVERELVLQTIIHCNGNRTRAARMLRVSIRTIRNKLREYSAAAETYPRQLTSRAPRTPGAKKPSSEAAFQ